MKTYTTILIDVNNITYELHNQKYIPKYEKEMLEKIIKNGIRSLNNFEVIGLLGKEKKYGEDYILKNHINNVKLISRDENILNNSNYLEYILKKQSRNKKEVLVVSGNPNMLNSANLLEIDTCYFNLFNHNSNIKTDITINKLEELNKYIYKPINTTESEISSLNHYYIDPKLIEILKENGINLKHKYTDIDKFLNDKNNQNEKIAFTMNLFNIEYLRRKGCITCFVNNHSNDNIDYTTDYECLIEDFPKQLEKIINK